VKSAWRKTAPPHYISTWQEYTLNSEQVAQRSCGCPLPGSIQGQVGQGFGQPGLVEGVPAHGRGVGTTWAL